ncbi:MAG: hypothetical protein PHF25_06565 [Candidatus Margulisbacteria bacterium]|nr:hypothetical protein [Candidatus Margulisiibacteriota bacterium]
MKQKIIALNKITSKKIDDSYRVLFKTLTHTLRNIQHSLDRTDPILHEYQKDEVVSVQILQIEINYIESSLELCLTKLENFEKLLGEKYLATIDKGTRKTKNAIYKKRRIFLAHYNLLNSELFSLLDLIKQNPSYIEEKAERVDFLDTYTETQNRLDYILDLLNATRKSLKL